MVSGVGKHVESDLSGNPGGSPALTVRMLGPLMVSRDGVALVLPNSRKVRGLLAYLALAPEAVQRSHLCELLWDIPNDPRGELRWSLSKLRSILDEPGRRRVIAVGDAVKLDLSDFFVDVVEIARATQAGIETLGRERLQVLSALFVGDFLDGLDIERSPPFDAWVIAQRRRYRECHAAVLECLVNDASEGTVLGYLESWLKLAPFDRRVHELLLQALARKERIQEGEEHLASTARLFEAEGLDHAPLRAFWKAARNKARHSLTGLAVPNAEPALACSSTTAEPTTLAASRRASIAVLAFDDLTGTRSFWVDGLVRDVITRLAKLRSLFVIAQGTVFALQDRRVDTGAAGRMLDVDYIVTGSAQRADKRVTVSVELTETRTARIVWADVFNRQLDDVFLVLDEIGNRIVASIASEIEANERNRSVLKPPGSLDAWEAHHRGLWHMYRFNKADNERAAHYFEMSLRLDPTFSRAHAGLSFTHWQNAFQGWASREPEIERAFESAGRSLMADDQDPAAHLAMGRALWLRNQTNQSVLELETAVALSPNFAMGHYTLGFVRAQAGDPRSAIEASDHSRHLSPFDPLLFGMLGARAIALVRLGAFEEAADWAIKAAARPNAHAHILAIAAYSLALTGRLDEARNYWGSVSKSAHGYSIEDFLRAFRFEPQGADLFRKAAKRLGRD